MRKFIETDKLLAEIERRIKETESMKPSFDQFWAGQISAFKGVKTIITTLQQEQPEVDLEKLVNEEFASHCRTTEYGLVATYNRAELYQFIKRMAIVFNARKEE